MSRKELLDLVHQAVCDSFRFYRSETAESLNSLVNTIQSSDKTDLQDALFNYTMATSETTCIAMAKILISAGILNISEEDG